MDVLGQLTREEGPSYTARQMLALGALEAGNGTRVTVKP